VGLIFIAPVEENAVFHACLPRSIH
jgi:hypothetical protein